MIQQANTPSAPVPDSEVWAAVRELYIQTEADIGELAEQYGLSAMSVHKTMHAQDWDAQRMLFLDKIALEARSRFGRELERMAQEELLPAMRDHSALCRDIRQAMREELSRGGVLRQGGDSSDDPVILGKSAFNKETLELLDRETKLLALIVSGGRALPETSGDDSSPFGGGESEGDSTNVIEIT